MMVMCSNGKYAGGRMVAVPTACLNDGLLDLCLHHGPAGTKALLNYIKNCVIRKGMHVYDDGFNGYAYLRARSLKIKNKNMKVNSTTGEKETQAAQGNDLRPVAEMEPQMFQIDGEDLWFNNFVKIEVVPGTVDLLVDYNEMMQQKNLIHPSPKL